MIWAFLVLGAYLLGAISPSYLLVRRLRGQDIRTIGSLNAGATNVLRMVGSTPAVGVLLLDLAKGAIPTLIARDVLDAPGPIVGVTALATVLGHVFPLYLGWRGGKGVATAAGALATLAPLPALMSVLAFVLVVLSSRYVALGSLAGVCSFPLLVTICGRLGWTSPPASWLVPIGCGIAALITYKHLINLRRIRVGEEYRLGSAGAEEQL